ncbi:hypothetical protein LTR78_002857 [Recurvomyces mirabilis]|uniref:Arabinanase/levansucrase/invertase n=1 Tax=Recurvomyces mirabilis TaxID=574656 RepID=A0AAE1C3Z7_9PEZI|nr:hypothetical protein LTR78_002857 [Recurvomyces mirabilis]KAK5159410.1 hypothetical protein LTS14_002552 [Recurvomyces mirabilis]
MTVEVVDEGRNGGRTAGPTNDLHSSAMAADATPADHMRSDANSPSPRRILPGLAAFTVSRKASPVAADPLLQHDASPSMRNVKLSFWQRHFTRPVDLELEKEGSPQKRRFVFSSRGAIFTGIIMLLLLLGVVAAAVAVTMHARYEEAHEPSPIRAALDDNFPDPALWHFDGTYYAFATNNAAGILQRPNNSSSYDYGVSNIQIATSQNFINWTLLNSTHDPLPHTGDWVAQGLTKGPPRIPRANVWAPDVIRRPSDKKFVMYYSANRVNATAPGGPHPPTHCIGAAVSASDSPAGPYKAENDTLACPIDQGGAIDPGAFKDEDGTLYVVYKVDGNNIGHGGVCGNTKAPIMPTPLMLQKMKADGVTTDGAPVQIMDRKAQDGPLVEAPALVRSKDGIYFLFFSSGCTRAPSYDIKYATSKNINGPYTRADSPLLRTGDFGLLAPGSASVHDDGADGYNMVFHARVQAPQGRIRAMFTTKLIFKGHTVTMASDTQKDD